MSNNVTVSINKEYALTSDKMKAFYSQVGLDLSFNSEERWDGAQASRYATSLVTGMAPSKIIVANIDVCIDPTLEGSSDRDYFQSWLDQGKKYIAIDGNNRTITINKYLNGDVSIIHGEYVLPNGPVIIGSHNDKYHTHPKPLKEYIENNVKITICEYIAASRVDLSRIFINVNNGIALNAQEMRNAQLVPIAGEVRDLSSTYAKAFKHIFKNGNGRRNIDDQIANMAVYHTYGADHGVSKKDKDEAYTDNSTVWTDFIAKGGKKSIEETLKILTKFGDANLRETSALMNFYMVIDSIITNKQNILDKKELYNWFVRTENKRMGDPSVAISLERGETRNFAGCCRAMTRELLLARYEIIMRDLQSIPDNIITSVDPERLFTTLQRYKMWEVQGAVCPQTGKPIPEEEINNHEIWAADHIFPYSKGGPTTVENGQLVCKTWNQQKGAKLMNELKAA
jgi:hypothetical protein